MTTCPDAGTKAAKGGSDVGGKGGGATSSICQKETQAH